MIEQHRVPARGRATEGRVRRGPLFLGLAQNGFYTGRRRGGTSPGHPAKLRSADPCSHFDEGIVSHFFGAARSLSGPV